MGGAPILIFLKIDFGCGIDSIKIPAKMSIRSQSGSKMGSCSRSSTKKGKQKQQKSE